ncbi:MAG: type II secretion system protein [Elusimicrobiaceae bacterium]|nr:type II secretion system protein [Elusimicrobiaceae bacterium]
MIELVLETGEMNMKSGFTLIELLMVFSADESCS